MMRRNVIGGTRIIGLGASIAILLGAPALCAGENERGDQARRIEFIQNALDSGQRNAEFWWYSWMGIYGTSGIIQTALAFLPENRAGERVLDVTEAAKSFVGLAALFVPPFSPAYAGNSLGKVPGETPVQRAHKLASAEDFLNDAADIEAFGTSVLMHLGGVAVNAVGFGVEWYYAVNQMHRSDLIWQVIGNAVVGLAAGEAAILTQPTKAVKDRERYRKEFPGEKSSGFWDHAAIGYSPGGLSFVWKF